MDISPKSIAKKVDSSLRSADDAIDLVALFIAHGALMAYFKTPIESLGVESPILPAGSDDMENAPLWGIKAIASLIELPKESAGPNQLEVVKHLIKYYDGLEGENAPYRLPAAHSAGLVDYGYMLFSKMDKVSVSSPNGCGCLIFTQQ